MLRTRAGFAALAALILCVSLLLRFQLWSNPASPPTTPAAATTTPAHGEGAQEEPLGNAIGAPNSVLGKAERPAQVEPRVAAVATGSPDLSANKEPGFFGFPPDFIELVQLLVTETNNGNHTAAALLALDAIELSRDYPEKHEFLHQLAGLNYEKAGLTDFAIEQYTLALAINPEQRSSYDGLRRLDPEFRAANPPLPAL